MPRIRCHYEDCVYLDEGYCTAALVEIDPDQGCLTYRAIEEIMEEDWEEPLEDDLLDEDFLDEEDEDLWDEEDEDL